MPDGRIGIAVGDVTDKGVPAALVMARTHSVLRAEASRSDSPGEILARANALLVPEMPARMFVTCLFAILEPATGRIVLANAGHNLPYIRTADGVVELRATGCRSACCPTSATRRPRAPSPPATTSCSTRTASSKRTTRPGDVRLPAPAREMAADDAGSELLDRLLETSTRSPDPIGSRRTTSPSSPCAARPGSPRSRRRAAAAPARRHGVHVPGEEGNERLAMDRVAAAVADLGLAPARLERLKTAVSETAMNAIEYGSQGEPDIPVESSVETTAEGDRRPDHGPRPVRRRAERARGARHRAKLAGEQKPRGWGLFLIRNMVDSMDVTSDGPTRR